MIFLSYDVNLCLNNKALNFPHTDLVWHLFELAGTSCGDIPFDSSWNYSDYFYYLAFIEGGILFVLEIMCDTEVLERDRYFLKTFSFAMSFPCRLSGIYCIVLRITTVFMHPNVKWLFFSWDWIWACLPK